MTTRILRLGPIAGLGPIAAAALLLAAAFLMPGCSDEPGTTTSQPQTTVTTADPDPTTTTTERQSTTSSSVSPSTVPSVPPSAPLTMDQVKNAEITVGSEDEGLTFTLVGGRYEGPAGDDGPVVSVAMTDAALGDLDGDGVGDAAIAVSVERAAVGGSGAGKPGLGQAAAYVVALLAQGDAPVQAGHHLVGLGARVDELRIDGGEIRLEGALPGPDDPAGDPVVPLTATLRLPLSPTGPPLLLHTSQSTKTPAGDVREITITSHEWGASVVYVGVISGTVTIAPFENNLVYSVYDPEMNELLSGPLAVDAPDLGAPGTFELVLDLIALGCWGEVFLTISDLSAADGSILAMDSITLENFAPG